MAIDFNGREYLMGPALTRTTLDRGWDDVGSVRHANQNCTVFMNWEGSLVIQVQHLNTQFPTFYPLATQAQLMYGWR